jgi:hypothetical protein
MAREEEGFFDDLARGLADGTLTRGKALRLMGAALVGGSLASLGIREAAADRPGCKRIGKNCTRDPQCCGSLVCVSGTCQAQTTTTSTSSTTSTTTSTTSTSTTTCSGLPNGATCTTSSECCSDLCVEVREGVRVCAAPPPICPPDCPGLPQCSCETEFFSGEPVCVQPIVRIETDCNACDPLVGEVCVTSSPGFVGCSPPCP